MICYAICICVLFVSACTKSSLPLKIYSATENNIEIEWRAYKYSEKLGVNGKFLDFQINGLSTMSTIKDMLTDISIDINTESLSTNSTSRDNNILTYFFRKLDNHEVISGEVIKVTGTETKGKAIVSLTFNNQTHEVPFEYQTTSQKLVLKADMNLENWQAAKTLDHFKDCCEDYHTGEDGVHIIWPNVSIKISTLLEMMS